MCRRLLLATAALLAAAAATAQPAAPSRFLMLGLFEENETLFGNPDWTFPVLRQMRTQVLRVNLYWGGSRGVARRRPASPANPNDPAYEWGVYDRTVQFASRHGIKLVFSIYGTPPWAGPGFNRAPTRASDLRSFANAAARRYGGRFRGEDGTIIPAVKMWLAWNEPNNPVFLKPQYRKVGARYVLASPGEYAKICNAVYAGVHGTMIAGEKVGCGVTGPRGNNDPSSARASVSPLAFLRGMKKAGIKRFDVYAHHPYYGHRSETPSTRPPGTTAVTLGNIDVLVRELTRLYGNKRLWLTEYGYQTNPPDRTSFGVSWALQARYLRESYAIARRHPRIDMLLWFLLKDEPRLEGWQSGFFTVTGRKKPAFNVFRSLRP